jgi:hypothetical protein
VGNISPSHHLCAEFTAEEEWTMTFRLLDLFRGTFRKNHKRPVLSARPQLEVLEDRVTPALINHGGPVLASIQAQAVYLGSGWNGATPFDGFLNTTVNGTSAAPSPYLAMLKNAAFTGVTGAGSTLADVNDPVSLSGTVTDAGIQTELQNQIKSGALQPNTNSLYFVFVQPNVVVSFGNGQDSTNTFLAYHSSFSYNGSLVRYAVVPNHGTAGNAQDAWLTSPFDSMTVAASHEMAEAITDPDGSTYFDRAGNEVGDIVNGSTVYLNGYAVQREASIPATVANFLPMTPTGSTAGHAVTFSVVAGVLNVSEDGGVTFTAAANPSGEKGKVVSISTQGIDDFGQPMIDVVFSDGNAYEYHDFAPNTPTAIDNPSFFPWTSLGGNVKQAVAGQAVSYVLFTNGNLEEFVDPNYFTYYYGYGVNPGARRGVIASGVTSIIAAGVDQLGVNAVEYSVTSHGKTTTYEWRDVTGQASTSTAGFIPEHLSEVPTSTTISSQAISLVDAETTTTSTTTSPTQPVKTPTHPDVPTIDIIVVDVRPVVVLPLTNGVPGGIPAVPPTPPADAGITSQGPVLVLSRAQSGSADNGELLDEDDWDGRPIPCNSSILPDTLPAAVPAAAPALPAVEVPMSNPDASQSLAIADEVWTTWSEPVSLPLQDEDSSPVLALAVAALFPSALFSQRRSWRRTDRPAKGRIW